MNHSTDDEPTQSSPDATPTPQVSRMPGRYQWTVAIVSGIALTLVALKISKYSVGTSIALGLAAVLVSHLIQAMNRGR
jgi:hypothetical protein